MPNVGSHAGSGVYRKPVSQPFLPASLYSAATRGHCSIDGCGAGVSTGGGEFNIFLHHHLEPEPRGGFIRLKDIQTFMAC